MATPGNTVELVFKARDDTRAAVASVIASQAQVARMAKESAAQQKASVAPVADEFNKLRNTLISLGEGYHATGTIGRQALTSLALQIKQLEDAHGGAEQAALRLAGAEKQIYDSAKASLQDAIVYQRQFNDEQQKIGRQTRDWVGLRGSIEGVGGTLGNVAKVAGGVVLAFSEGWRIGKQLDSFLKENSETWRKWGSISTAALRGTNAELANNLNLSQRTRDLLPQIIARQNRQQAGQGGIGADAGLRAMQEVQEELQRGINDRTREAEDLAKKAADATRQWREEVEKLAGVGAATVREQKILAEAIERIDRQTGKAGSGAVVFADNLNTLADRARVTGGVFIRELIPAMERLFELETRPQIGSEFSTIGRALARTAAPVINQTGLDAYMKRVGDQLKKDTAAAGEKLKRDAEEAGRLFAETFQQPMTDIFTDLALTGGANFGRIAGQMFGEAVRSGAESFVSLISRGLSSVFGGGTVTQDASGNYFINGQPASQADATAAQQRNARIGQVAGGVVGAGAQFASVLGQSGGQRQSALSTVASFTLQGAGIGSAFPGAGTIIGAAIGAVVGGIAALLAPAQGQDYSYGRFGVRGGQAFFDYSARGGEGREGQLQNISANAARTARAQIESAFGDTYGDFVRTLLRFPMEVLPQTFAQIGDILPDIGKEMGGDIGRAASANFWKDFELWFRQGMPRDIAERFRPVFAQAFEGMGFTIARFNEIWTSLQDLDPAEARALLDQWAQAATELPEAFAFLRQPFGGRGGGLDWAQREMRRSPADRLAEAYEPILRLANTLGNLPIAEQIRGWTEVNRQIQEVQQSFRDLLIEIAQGIQSVTESYGASIRELEIAGIQTPEGEPDYQGQAEYLRNYANDLRARIGSAASPAEALALGEELRGTIMQIYQLGQQLGPEAGEQFRLWALGALEEGRDAVIESLRVIGEEAAAENQRNLALLQAQWEEFTGAAAEATRDFTLALIDATGRIKNLLRGGGDGGDGGPKPLPEIQPIAPKDEGGAFFAGSGMLERLERIERAIGENAARSTQIIAGGLQAATSAIREGKEITVPVTIVQEASGSVSSAGPSSRRGR